ncbi:mitochondrial carrier [Punctularia strigosozonata HHB-11173 SS5]|uniref:mitochondrial carrier n=1 Tax=Punctularia strigosozonata (strain HHB-11173) TaxID=741275 RepID=UPI0004416A6F|nr:mitochondrial carrier [Punctularia strigosozonata HHB-11173 SS5]EIN11785.1 mitochondrial carrier [Punctularia strigosozonata HHB-11173 SS5]
MQRQISSQPSKTSQYGLKFCGAAFANMVASAVTNPVDVVKVRQQLRTQVAGSRVNAFWHVGAEIARREGFRSLMSGFTASMLREVAYSGLRLGAYEFFKDKIYGASNGALTRDGLVLKVCAATIASGLGSYIANPADLVKVRMQAYYPEGRPYRTTLHATTSIWREGQQGPYRSGLQALYRGVTATTVRGVVLSVSQICAYDEVKQRLKREGVMREGIALHSVSSMVAGLFCSITSNPIDVIKVRLMNDKDHKYRGTMDCVRSIVTKEGPLALYKGFGMCWARLGTHTILTFIVFERLRYALGIDPL